MSTRTGAGAPGETCNVNHIKTLSVCPPAKAQFESMLQFVGLAQAVLALFTGIMNTFGIPIPQKNPNETT